MKLTVNVKMINSKFNQAYADKENEGFETEDNIKYVWEDEFEVKENISNFKILNNAPFNLQYKIANNEKSVEIPNLTILECNLANESQTHILFSSKLIAKTEKVSTNNNIQFNVILKGSKDYVNPIEGYYFLKSDLPTELLNYLTVETEDESNEDI